MRVLHQRIAGADCFPVEIRRAMSGTILRFIPRRFSLGLLYIERTHITNWKAFKIKRVYRVHHRRGKFPSHLQDLGACIMASL